MRDRLPARKDLAGGKPTPHRCENRRLINTPMRLFEEDMTQIRRAKLTPDTEREKIDVAKPYSQRTASHGRNVAQEMHPPVARRGVIRQVDAFVEIHEPLQKRAAFHLCFNK